MPAVSENLSGPSADDQQRLAPPPPELTVLLLAGQFQARGSCSYTLRLAEHLGRYAVGARIACTSAAGIPASKRNRFSLQEFPFLQTPLISRLALGELLRLWCDRPPDLVHLQNSRLLPAAQYLCERFEVPYVATVHDFQWPHRRLLQSRWAGKVIAVSKAVKGHLIAGANVPEEMIQVIASGVELLPEPTPLPDRESADRVPVIGSAGPLERIKGHPYFLQAAQRVLNQGIDAEFLIAGAGPEESNLRRLTRLLGIAEKVTFAPYLQEFTEVLKSMDIFCLPSLQQGLGTVMLEAMAVGKPVIATGVGGVYSVVENGKTGLLVPRGDAAALAEKIVELLTDTQRARQLGNNARQLVAAQFGVDRMVERTARLYRHVLQQAPQTRPTSSLTSA